MTGSGREARDCCVTVITQNAPHTYADACGCIPCRALREAVDFCLERDGRLLQARCLPWEDSTAPFARVDAAKLTGLPAIPFARDVAERKPAGGANDLPMFTITYPGLWAAHEVTLQILPRARAYVAFHFVSKVEVKVLCQDSVSGQIREKTAVQETRVLPNASSALLEQWTDLEEAAHLVHAFASYEEATLEAGDIAWEAEGRGRTIIGEDKLQAFWHIGNKEYEVCMEALLGDGARERWTTRTLATWVLALEIFDRLPFAIFETSLWVEIGLCKAGTFSVLVRQRTAWGPSWKTKSPARVDIVYPRKFEGQY